jgi:NAD(P)-dependent dehydrogenase (short-subunit alcohol dehydrogenase family)
LTFRSGETMGRLDGKVAIVTGGGGAIGRAVAQAMAGEGASVVVGDLLGVTAEAAAATIRDAGGAAIGVPVDVSIRSDVEALADAAEEAFGVATVAFCSAGITSAGGSPALLELSDEEWDRVVAVNLRGTFLTSQIVAQRLVRAGAPGSIITVSSIGAERPMFGAPAYHTTKAAVSGLTRALAVNLAHHSIRANGIAPGYIATDMLMDVLGEEPERAEALLSRVPVRRFGETSDLTGAAVYLASDESAYVTGQVLHVDGGALVLGWTAAQAPPSAATGEGG